MFSNDLLIKNKNKVSVYLIMLTRNEMTDYYAKNKKKYNIKYF